MNPCLADTGSTLPVTLIAIAVVAVVGGTALFFVARRKKKRAIGTTTLALVLFGALAIGITPPTPAHAATGTECTQAVPAQTSTPTPTPARTTPAPTCTPAVINDDVDSWMTYYIDESSTARTLNGLTTNSALLAALHSGTVYNGTLLVVDEGGTTTFNGAVTFTAVPQSSAATLIAVSVADLPQGVPSLNATVTLSFQIPGASADCPTKVTVTSTYVVPE